MGVEEVFALVRSIGERTTPLCVSALEAELGDLPMVVSFPVFRETLRCCYSMALESGFKYLLTCDADVVPYAGSVDELLRLNREVPTHYFQVVCRVDDHLFGKPRTGGMRLYRVSALQLALSELASSDATRPESSLVRSLGGHGRPSAYCDSVIGMHDAGQYLADVYRTAYFFAHKHAASIPELAAHWRAAQSGSSDLRVALAGLADGLQSSDPGPDARSFNPASAAAVLERLGLYELAPIDGDDLAEWLDRRAPLRRMTRWTTYPYPRGLARSAELRRNEQSILADFVRRLWRARQ